MRLGVLDVGSNTVHLLVVDAHVGAAPVAATSRKTPLMLAELMDDDGAVTEEGVYRLTRALTEARHTAAELEVEELTAFATSALREASNGDEVLKRVRDDTGVELEVLDGVHEASLTFLAVRRWFGWSPGRLLVLDIGGGSLELASGVDEVPDAAASVPLGAGRLTRERLPGDPPAPAAIKDLDRYVRDELAGVTTDLLRNGRPGLAVGTSKTFRTLARIGRAAPHKDAPSAREALARHELRDALTEMAAMSAAQRAKLPGVSPTRAHQLVAGAVVALATMDLLDVDKLTICPWALREGVILRRLEWLSS